MVASYATLQSYLSRNTWKTCLQVLSANIIRVNQWLSDTINSRTLQRSFYTRCAVLSMPSRYFGLRNSAAANEGLHLIVIPSLWSGKLKIRTQVYSEKRIWSRTVHLQILYTFAYTSTGHSTRPQYQLHFFLRTRGPRASCLTCEPTLK